MLRIIANIHLRRAWCGIASPELLQVVTIWAFEVCHWCCKDCADVLGAPAGAAMWAWAARADVTTGDSQNSEQATWCFEGWSSKPVLEAASWPSQGRRETTAMWESSHGLLRTECYEPSANMLQALLQSMLCAALQSCGGGVKQGGWLSRGFWSAGCGAM